MNWNEIVEKQVNEFRNYLNGSKQSRDLLQKDKAMILKEMNCKEEDLSKDMRDKLKRDEDAWKKEWGRYGSQFKTWMNAQEKEVNTYHYRQNLAQEFEQENENDNGAGR